MFYQWQQFSTRVIKWYLKKKCSQWDDLLMIIIIDIGFRWNKTSCCREFIVYFHPNAFGIALGTLCTYTHYICNRTLQTVHVFKSTSFERCCVSFLKVWEHSLGRAYDIAKTTSLQVCNTMCY